MSADATTGGRWRVGVDIGGTFTDIVALDPATGEQRLAKVPTVRATPLSGIVDGLAAVSLGWADVAELVHGTTLVTNALVEGKTAPVTLVATRGFEDVLAIARQSRRALYDMLAPPRLPPDVPRARCVGVDERLDADGIVVRGLTPDAAREAAADALACTPGDGAIAVALLHAYANPAHERALGAVLREQCRHVSLSHEVSPEAREYERTLTTALNASVMPLTGDYVERLAADIPATTRLHLFHSAGGMTTLATARDRPLTLAMSGPAAGAVAAAAAARTAGLARVLTFDMGGTTTDVSLILDGRVEIASNRRIAGRPVRQPMVAIESVGAGGGSLVKLGTGGLSVGPDSAGADPGPAVYGRGGAQATITDALALLGYLDPARVLGGSIRLDLGAAERALQPVAQALGLGLVETALGIVRVADATMARALRRVSIERGVDARSCALVAFGGAGPMHACGLAEEMGIAEVLVPASSGGFSALGCVAAAPSCTVQQTIRLNAANDWEARLAAARRELASRAQAQLGGAATSTSEVALIRYLGQSDHVEVPFAGTPSREALGAMFRDAHVRLYGYATDEPWEVEALRVSVAGDAPAAATMRNANGHGGDALLKTQRCHFARGGALDTKRLDRAALAPDTDVAGPAIIEDSVSTVVVAPGWHAQRTRDGSVRLTKTDPA